MRKISLNFVLTSLLLSGISFAQQPDMNSERVGPIETTNDTPVFRVNVIERSAKAVNYRHHSGKTKIDFRGTDLMPDGSGRATIESRTGRLEIDADLEHLRSPRTFGPEYLTYVLWAITPEGRPANLGEIGTYDGQSSVKVTTDLQAFGLIVTAEPYFAVTHPSNVVVLENVIRPTTKGWEEPIDAKFDAFERGTYTIDIDPSQLPATTSDSATPIDLLEARNAVAIAQAEGAETYAPESFSKAQDFLQRAEDYLTRGQSGKAISTVARGAVQSAEDSRLLTIRSRQVEEQESERRAMEQRETDARAQAQAAEEQESVARSQAAEEQRRRIEAEQERHQAELAKDEAERLRRQAEAARDVAVAQQQEAQAQAERSRLSAEQAEQQGQQTRQRLLAQLNEVLETRESTRGLIVDMPDILFDSGRYTLTPGAQQRLSKVAGILVAYPDLQVQVEGHTDDVGGADLNQQLSRQRADEVLDFLVQQGVRRESIESRGIGMREPVASNDSPTGRQLNRRVDLVVTGGAIGLTNGPLQQQPTVDPEPSNDWSDQASPAPTQPRSPTREDSSAPVPPPSSPR